MVSSYTALSSLKLRASPLTCSLSVLAPRAQSTQADTGGANSTEEDQGGQKESLRMAASVSPAQQQPAPFSVEICDQPKALSCTIFLLTKAFL